LGASENGHGRTRFAWRGGRTDPTAAAQDGWNVRSTIRYGDGQKESAKPGELGSQ
jgi:hypothetical protein